MYFLLISLGLNFASSSLNSTKSLYNFLKSRKCKNTTKVKALSTMVDLNQSKKVFSLSLK